MEGLITPEISDEENAILTWIPDSMEILDTLKRINAEKAPGLNGMTVLFLISFWKIVSQDVIKTD